MYTVELGDDKGRVAWRGSPYLVENEEYIQVRNCLSGWVDGRHAHLCVHPYTGSSWKYSSFCLRSKWRRGGAHSEVWYETRNGAVYGTGSRMSPGNENIFTAAQSQLPSQNLEYVDYSALIPTIKIRKTRDGNDHHDQNSNDLGTQS